MKILIVKTSSLGDVIHTLPALTDAIRHIPNLHFDWVVEENFAEIPPWHPNVEQVLPVAWRRWRKNLPDAWRQRQLQQFYKNLRQKNYDLIIDAQGLFKSALMARMAKGLHCGLDYHSAREPLASLLYQRRFNVAFEQHAVTRVRQLFAHVLNYPCPKDKPDYAIHKHFSVNNTDTQKNILFIHGTTWTTKEWPEAYWTALANRCVKAGWHVQIPWGNAIEKSRAERIAESASQITVLPKSSLSELAHLLLQAKAAVAVDTGIGHLAAALSVPTISLYGPTDPMKIGAYGDYQVHLRKTDNIADLSVDDVWEKLSGILVSNS